MGEEYARIAHLATQLAVELPVSLVRHLASVIAACEGQDWGHLRQQILSVTPQPRFGAHIDGLLTVWREDAPAISPQAVAAALHAATSTAVHYREAQSVELVWTGPEVMEMPLRRTDQALLEVIGAAQKSLLVVSFAVYKIPEIIHALIGVFDRGVDLRICVEAPEPKGQRMAYDTIKALGRDVQQRAEIYIWPRDQRPTDPTGKVGSLHAKCAVADEQVLFISSANLTEYAMALNLELGTLIRGGPLPGMVSRYFVRLIERGVLRRVHTT